MRRPLSSSFSLSHTDKTHTEGMAPHTRLLQLAVAEGW